jgi:hypothetical protein
MDGRAFLVVARDLARFPTEGHQRTAVVSSYYALFLECREALVRWGFPPPTRHDVHSFVRLKFAYATHPELNTIGSVLERGGRLRNQASYQLSAPTGYWSAARVSRAIQDATDALALLDAIDGDPARRAAAVAVIPP